VPTCPERGLFYPSSNPCHRTAKLQRAGCTRLCGTRLPLLPTPLSSSGAASPQSTLWPGGWPRAHRVASFWHHASVLVLNPACTEPIHVSIYSPTHYPVRNPPNPPPRRSASQLSKTAWNYGAIPLVFIFMYAFRGVCLLALNPIFKLLGTSESQEKRLAGRSNRPLARSTQHHPALNLPVSHLSTRYSHHHHTPTFWQVRTPPSPQRGACSPCLLQSCPCLALHL
jgi:hypothetical protein